MDDTELYADLNVDDPDQQEAKTLNLDDDTQRYLELRIENEFYEGGAPSPSPTPTTDLMLYIDKDGNFVGNLESIPSSFVGYGSTTTRKFGLVALAGLIKTLKFDKATSVGSYAFVKASSLETVDLPACTLVSSCGFYECIGISNVNLPVCRDIGTYAFHYCYFLTTLDLPACVSVGAYAFDSCEHLTTFILRAETVAGLTNTSAFTSTPIASGTGYIYVPDALVDSYKTATNWSVYADQIKPLSELPA